MGLDELYKEHGELFGVGARGENDKFPLLTKIIDAKSDLSIQVHPDDEYAKVHENGSLGKTECWYVLDCDEGASLVVGHNASSRDELCKMMDEGRCIYMRKWKGDMGLVVYRQESGSFP